MPSWRDKLNEFADALDKYLCRSGQSLVWWAFVFGVRFADLTDILRGKLRPIPERFHANVRRVFESARRPQ